jgi:hypothetical protein
MARRAKDKPVMILRVVRGGYEPATAFDQEMHARFALGAEVSATIEQPKSLDLLRLYWGFLGFVVENADWPSDTNSLSKSLLTQLGYVENFVALMDGGILTHPRSIADMDHQEFKRYCDKAFDEIWDRFGLEVETYKAHLQSKAGGRR